MSALVLDPRTFDLPLPVRKRPDLVFALRPTPRRALWTVKDPLTLNYFQLRAEERFVLDQLDGRTSAAAIAERFFRQFAPRKLAAAEVITFVRRLFDQGLVFAEEVQRTERGILDFRFSMFDSHSTSTNPKSKIQNPKSLPPLLLNPLAIRFRGVDPQRFLDAAWPFVRPLLSPVCLLLAAVLVLSAVGLIAVEWDAFRRRLPGMEAFLRPQNMAWLLVALAGVKVLHELGHAFVCKRFGGEVREIGLMLLAFTPCLYCNVSDAWLLPNKWHRIAVSAAGIGVELVLAAACTWLWWFSVPGTFNSLCLYVMAVGSVNTLLLNGNPLLRYDGYYVLSDLVEVPNLRSRATAAARRTAARCVLGIDERSDETVSPAGTVPLVLYGFASSVYLWVVMFAILWLVHRTLKPYGLEATAVLLAVLLIGGRAVTSSRATARRLRTWRATGQLRRGRASVGILVAFVLAAVLLAVPLPYHVTAPCRLRVLDARSVYVTEPGRIAVDGPVVSYGTTVAAGQTLAVLQSHAVDLDLVRLQGERDRQARRLDSLGLRQFTDPTAGEQVPTATAMLQDLDQRLAQRRRDREALTLTAPTAGEVLPPPEEHARGTDFQSVHSGDLPPRDGPPLDPPNRGAFLPTGALVCLIGDPARMEGVLVVDQADIGLVKRGQPVRLLLPQLSSSLATGRVSEIARVDVTAVPRELALEHKLPSRVTDRGVVRPASATYEVRVALDETPSLLTPGGTGDARIRAGTMSLAERGLRWARQTFAAEL